jgi:trigger factor
MHISKDQTNDTLINLTFSLNEADLSPFKQAALKKMARDLKIDGFRPGKVPAAVVEKNVDPSLLQTEVIEMAVNDSYGKALDEHAIRPVAQPDVSIKKFVPFTQLEFETGVSVIGKITLPDYTKITMKKDVAKVVAKDVTEVLDSLKSRAADGKEVKRAVAKGDRTTISFKGVNEKGEAIQGAEGSDYPLVIGSNSFIPGFEDELIGKSAGKPFDFDITFPKDYDVAALASKKVTFTVTIAKVEELIEPKLDDAFAASIGPFKTMEDLKADIKVQLQQERQSKIDREYEQELIEKIIAKSKLSVPQALIDEQVESMLREQKQNLMYRGQTWEEFLKLESKTEEAYRKEVVVPQAELRVKAGLILAEIADKEGITVTKDELEVRLQLLRGQYQDPAMQAELDKPENQRDIGGRIITEKTVEKLVSLANK